MYLTAIAQNQIKTSASGYLLSTTYLKMSLLYIILDWIQTKDVLVVHFEDFLVNRKKELQRILKFFDFGLDEKRLSCASNVKFDKYKRKKIEFKKSPFSEQAFLAIEEQVERVNELLKKYKHKQIKYSRDNF